MKDLIDYCDKNNLQLRFAYKSGKISLAIKKLSFLEPIYYIEGNKQAYYRLIESLKTRINLDAIR